MREWERERERERERKWNLAQESKLGVNSIAGLALLGFTAANTKHNSYKVCKWVRSPTQMCDPKGC